MRIVSNRSTLQIANRNYPIVIFFIQSPADFFSLFQCRNWNYDSFASFVALHGKMAAPVMTMHRKMSGIVWDCISGHI